MVRSAAFSILNQARDEPISLSSLLPCLRGSWIFLWLFSSTSFLKCFINHKLYYVEINQQPSSLVWFQKMTELKLFVKEWLSQTFCHWLDRGSYLSSRSRPWLRHSAPPFLSSPHPWRTNAGSLCAYLDSGACSWPNWPVLVNRLYKPNEQAMHSAKDLINLYARTGRLMVNLGELYNVNSLLPHNPDTQETISWHNVVKCIWYAKRGLMTY